jgi:hypothetical protein
VRYDRRVIESFVDLTYRGLSLGRRIRLSQVRPSSGYLELPAPMPVGTRIAIAADDGVAFEATVTALHEQVGGSDRAPGMTVSPALAAEPAAAWWRARVALADNDAGPRGQIAGGRSQPVTPRPGSAGDPPPLARSVLDAGPASITGVDAGAAAGGDPDAADDAGTAHTTVMPVFELEAEAPPDPPAAPAMRRTGEHAVVDDGNRTMIMESIDPATFGIDLMPGPAPGLADADADADADAAEDDADPPDVGDAGDPGDAAESTTIPDSTTIQRSGPPAGRGRKKRKFRR